MKGFKGFIELAGIMVVLATLAAISADAATASVATGATATERIKIKSVTCTKGAPCGLGISLQKSGYSYLLAASLQHENGSPVLPSEAQTAPDRVFYIQAGANPSLAAYEAFIAAERSRFSGSSAKPAAQIPNSLIRNSTEPSTQQPSSSQLPLASGDPTKIAAARISKLETELTTQKRTAGEQTTLANTAVENLQYDLDAERKERTHFPLPMFAGFMVLIAAVSFYLGFICSQQNLLFPSHHARKKTAITGADIPVCKIKYEEFTTETFSAAKHSRDGAQRSARAAAPALRPALPEEVMERVKRIRLREFERQNGAARTETPPTPA